MSTSPVFQVANIPAELRTLRQWVCWHFEERNGKRTKTPIDAKSNGKLLYAKPNDPETWADFDTAVATATRLKLEGIGLNVWKDDGLTGLDLDHVLDPATGELDPLAIEVLDRFAGTYAEISPSGTGLRIWCHGKAARSGKCVGKLKWLEVYSHPSNRYLTVTGNHWADSETAVTEQQAALDWLHSRFMVKDKTASTERERVAPPSVGASLDLDDTALLVKASQAKNGSAFDALWSGDLSAQGDDASSADLALCNHLAFWTGNDATRMDRLFRQSGLMRPKWDEIHYSDGRTYGAMTVDKAIAGSRETYSGKKPRGKARSEISEKQPSAAGWQSELMRRSDSDQLLKNHYNAVLVVENAYPGLIGYNEFRQRIEARIPTPWGKRPGKWNDEDTGELAFYLTRQFASFSIDALNAAIMVVAHRHPFNPAQERLRALAEQWDGVNRLDGWLADYLNAGCNASNGDYLREIGGAWLKGVAARVLFPGCKRDDVLVLRGSQGFLKSTAAECIADAIHPESFTDHLGDLGSKDSRAAIRGMTIAEFGELAALNKSDLESIKAFVAGRNDHFREAYGRGERDHPRTVSFIGTTNDPTFLKDPSGNRRWWPVTITAPINIPRFKEVLPQLIGEAARKVITGEKWFVQDAKALTQADDVRAAHFTDDVWTDAALIAAGDLLNSKPPSSRWITVAEVMERMGLRLEQQTVASQMRVGGILRVNKWEPKRKRVGKRLVGIWMPESIPPIEGGYRGGIHQEASETADVLPYPPISPLFEESLKETGNKEDSAKVDHGDSAKTDRSGVMENRGIQGDRGDTGGYFDQGTARDPSPSVEADPTQPTPAVGEPTLAELLAIRAAELEAAGCSPWNALAKAREELLPRAAL